MECTPRIMGISCFLICADRQVTTDITDNTDKKRRRLSVLSVKSVVHLFWFRPVLGLWPLWLKIIFGLNLHVYRTRLCLAAEWANCAVYYLLPIRATNSLMAPCSASLSTSTTSLW